MFIINIQHFFGGAMGVFTTQALLCFVGVSKNRATPGAVAINWILNVNKQNHHKLAVKWFIHLILKLGVLCSKQLVQ